MKSGQRFDADVERFSEFGNGTVATVDAPHAMLLVAQAAAAVTPQARQVVDVAAVRETTPCGCWNCCPGWTVR